jgi:hypothetical protein
MFLCIQRLISLDLRLGVKDLFMHKKHSLHALNIKITILRGSYPTILLAALKTMSKFFGWRIRIFKTNLFVISFFSIGNKQSRNTISQNEQLEDLFLLLKRFHLLSSCRIAREILLYFAKKN